MSISAVSLNESTTPASICGVERRVLAAYPGRVPSSEAEGFQAPPLLRNWAGIGRPVHSIVGPAKILLIVGLALIDRLAPAGVLSECRAEGYGKNRDRDK